MKSNERPVLPHAGMVFLFCLVLNRLKNLLISLLISTSIFVMSRLCVPVSGPFSIKRVPRVQMVDFTNDDEERAEEKAEAVSTVSRADPTDPSASLTQLPVNQHASAQLLTPTVE